MGIFLISGLLLFIQGYALVANHTQKAPPSDSGAIDVQIRAIKNEWRFEPNEIIIPADSVVRLRIFNEDSYAHGFAIEELGIDKYMPPLEEIVVELANIKPGRYEFFCSVLCGKGHFEQRGVLIVR